MFHDVPDIALGLEAKRGGSNIKPRTMESTKFSLAPRNIISPWWGQTYGAVLQHGPLSRKTKFEGPWIGFLVFTVWPLDDFQGPLDFHGHGSWFLDHGPQINT